MTKELTIEGMSCQHCVHAVKEALAGVEHVEIKEVEIGRAVIDVAPGNEVESAVREALDEEGYPLKAMASLAE